MDGWSSFFIVIINVSFLHCVKSIWKSDLSTLSISLLKLVFKINVKLRQKAVNVMSQLQAQMPFGMGHEKNDPRYQIGTRSWN